MLAKKRESTTLLESPKINSKVILEEEKCENEMSLSLTHNDTRMMTLSHAKDVLPDLIAT